MTALLAIVKTQAEAVAALAHGADAAALVEGGGSKLDPVAGARIGRMFWPAQGDDASTVVREIGDGRGPLWLPLAEHWTAAIRTAIDAGRHVVGCIDAVAGESAPETAKRAGVTDVLVATPPFSGRRLFDATSVADLARLAQLCRDAGLRYGFAGALEAPDVPRLQALTPDVIGFDTALRDESDRFDASGLDCVRVLIAETGPIRPGEDLADAERRSSPLGGEGGSRRRRETDEGSANPFRVLRDPSSGPSGHLLPHGEKVIMPTNNETTLSPDRIFVRDWTVPMSIGAYARERGRPQRVRVTVEAAVQPGPQHGLAGTVSYDLITDAIARIAAGHIDLVEEVAERLAALVLAHPRVLNLDITVEKLDVGPGSVGCRIVRRHPDR